MIDNDEVERWLTIPFASNYSVSSLGHVRRDAEGPSTTAGRIKKPSRSVYGYLVVNLVHDDGTRRVYPIHRLVCLTFRGSPPEEGRWEAAHNDGDRENCVLSNIEWKTPKQNTEDKYRHGTIPIGIKQWKAVLTDDDVRIIRRAEQTDEAMAKHFGVSQKWIYQVRTYRGRKLVPREQ